MTPCLTILFDNYPAIDELTALWGFSALLRMAGQTMLFDTRSSRLVLLRNMATLDSLAAAHLRPVVERLEALAANAAQRRLTARRP